MKTRLRQLGVVAASVTALAVMATVVGKAAVTVTTPNAATVNYSLAAGATSAAITPATNQPVILIGANIGTATPSVSSATLVHIPSTIIRWVGLESDPGGSISHGGSTTPGTHIIYLDSAHEVDVEILSADAIVIHNGSSNKETGSVKLIY